MSVPKNPDGGRRGPKRPRYALKVKIEGPGVRTKSIAVPDLLRICTALQSAVHRQAESMQDPLSPTLRRGPITAAATEECTLELVGITGGSTGLSFRYAKPQQKLPMPGSDDFGSDVLAQVASTVRGFSRANELAATVDIGVLGSLQELGDVFERKTITKISLIVPRHDGRPAIKAVFDPTVRKRIAARIKVPKHTEMSFEGKLEMADFKETGRACRLHPPIGLPILCTFEPDLEDQVYGALRRPVRLSGTARLNPVSGRTEELQIQHIEPLDELLLGAKDFFASRTLEQLAQLQGVRPLGNPAELAGGWPADEDVDEFVRNTYESRG